MAIDLFKAIQSTPSSVFARPKSRTASFIEQMASGAPPSSIYNWPGQKQPYSFTGPSSLAAASSPAERAYQTEKQRIGQLAAQNPELNRYETARKLAASPGATPEQIQGAKDIGMQIWAQKYANTLAPKVKPGQAGYEVIQKTLYPQGKPLPPLSAESQAMLDAVAPTNAQGIRPDITPMTGQPPVLGTESEAMYQAVTDGGRLVTPMSTSAMPSSQPVPAQDLVDAYKSDLMGDDDFAQRLRAMQQYM